MICFLDSILTKPHHVAGNYAWNYPLIQVCMCSAKLTSKVYVQQYLKAFIYARDEAHIH